MYTLRWEVIDESNPEVEIILYTIELRTFDGHTNLDTVLYECTSYYNRREEYTQDKAKLRVVGHGITLTYKE